MRITTPEMDPFYGVQHYLCRTIFDMCFRGEVHGQGNIPRRGPFLVACNHASHLDPPLIGSLVPLQMAFFARKTLWKPGFPAWWMNRVGAIPVDRDAGGDLGAIKRVLQTLKEGKALILFPEGRRSEDGRLQPAKAGVGMIACKSQAPVVPTRVFDSHLAFGRDKGLRLGTPVSVVYGPLLYPSDYDDPKAGKERYQIASERIMAAIGKLKRPTVTAV